MALGLAGGLAGCSLLFVQKGNTRYSSAEPQTVPTAPSLSKEMGTESGGSTYQSVPGDNLESIARAFYGDSRQAAYLGRVNRLKPGAALKPGRTLQIPATPPPLPPPSVRPSPSAEYPVPSVPAPDLRKVTRRVGHETYEMEVSDVKRIARPKVNRAFAVGERLKYQVKYFTVVGGTADLAVEGMEEFGGRPCYRFAAEAHSSFPFSNFYTVNDRLVSLFDAVDFFSWKFEKKVREGGYRETNRTDYRQLQHRALRLKNQDPPKEFAVPPYVQDVISAFYYFRLLETAPGDRVGIPTQAGDKNYELVVDVLKRETVTVRAGTFDCLLLKPHVRYDNFFQNKGEILLWVTADARHIPVLIQTKILIGSINIELVEAELPKL